MYCFRLCWLCFHAVTEKKRDLQILSLIRTGPEYGMTAMDMDYEPVRSMEDMPVYRRNRDTKGRYGWIEYIDETGILFRSYVKGRNSLTDGLQVYSDGVMVADVDVPEGFRVVGYIEPYYYSQVFEDDENGKLEIMRFRL